MHHPKNRGAQAPPSQPGQGVRNTPSRTNRPHPLYGQATFLCGATRGAQFPPDEGGEVAFAGRSNVGKSSAINTITGSRSLARTSKTPGRTQQINFFQLVPRATNTPLDNRQQDIGSTETDNRRTLPHAAPEARRLVDLPGYGYAKVPEAVRRTWAPMVENYLRGRQSLRGVVLLMDTRRPLTALDWQLVHWCRAAEVPFCVVLTKCDKLSHARAQGARRETLRLLAESGDGEVNRHVDVMLFSASRGEGIEALQRCLDGWLIHSEEPR
uniref:Probable GTP-binding protein EngB n=1 Tax=Candidatus Kentrum eta TaxID=2126337 RepID=A0A450UDG2_9GAMM|nr:MAG: GTP-binding protein [Candidatus Kentron sp. H]VFJ91581.1 MAG: GTP-binding protein [Candidatus Kentron sp. H]VFJ98169.1 MAG: GTP-binding protein [Candidatus Kentron sp. H]